MFMYTWMKVTHTMRKQKNDKSCNRIYQPFTPYGWSCKYMIKIIKQTAKNDSKRYQCQNKHTNNNKAEPLISVQEHRRIYIYEKCCSVCQRTQRQRRPKSITGSNKLCRQSAVYWQETQGYNNQIRTAETVNRVRRSNCNTMPATWDKGIKTQKANK